MNVERFVERSRKAHGDFYDYSRVTEKVSDHTKVTIICPEHGAFLQDPYSHANGHGCKSCSGGKSNLGRSRACAENFVKKAQAVHGDFYDYSLVEYRKAIEKVKIVCPLHGVFDLSPNGHLCGQGCTQCGRIRIGKNLTLSTEEFISRARKIHGDTYIYTQAKYVNSVTPVTIVCPTHGEFRQTPNVHLDKSGCPACGDWSGGELRKSGTADFIKLAREVHGDTYDYSLVKYGKNNAAKVKIVCKKHGEFLQSPGKHLGGCGCQTCGQHISKKEDEIRAFLSEFYETEGKDRKILNGREIDILVREKNIGIEYNGTIWHSERFNKDPVWHMKRKQTDCLATGIRLIHISDKEDITVVKKTLAHILGINDERYFARKCTVLIGRSSDLWATKFFNENHLQGTVTGCWVGALTINNQVVCAMSFSRATSIRGNSSVGLWELRRFASCCRVAGGASRLLKMFLRSHPECRKLISYSDNRWFTGEMYERLGFTLEKELNPDYKYSKNQMVEPKNHFSRTRLAAREDIDFRPEESEHQNCLRNGWYRIYDCGKKRWVMEVQ